MSIPENLKYTKEHEWVRVEGNQAIAGITDFAQNELGELVFVDLPPVGKAIKRGETLCVVESTKAASDVYAPISGVVKEVNIALQNAPDLVNKNPYTDGWLVKLEKFDTEETKSLLTPSSYKELVGGGV